MLSESSVELEDMQKKGCFSEKSLEEPVYVFDIFPTEPSAGSYSYNTSKCYNGSDMEMHLTESSKSRYATRIYQKRSFSEMSVTENMFRQIVEAHGVIREFCDLAASFHTTTDRIEAAYCAPLFKHISESREEYAYAFKYPERNGRTNGADPWSLRQTAVYYQYEAASGRTTWILLNPRPNSPAWQGLLARFTEQPSKLASRFNDTAQVHISIMRCYLDNWRPFLADHERQISETSRTLMGTRVEHLTELNQDTLGTIRYLQSRVLPAKVIISSCKGCIKELLSLTSHAVTKDPGAAASPLTSNHSWLDNQDRKLTSYQESAEALNAQCSFTAQLLYDRLAFRDQHVLQKQNRYALELTRLSVDDSATVTVITVITLAYLSFTVVATIMELPFFHLAPGTESLELSSQFWIYIAISVPLTTLTIGYWRLKMRAKARERRDRFPRDEESQKPPAGTDP